MMSDSTNNNKVNGHIMSLQQLISAPLVATIDADAMSTERYMKHFMSLAFESYNPVDGSTRPHGEQFQWCGKRFRDSYGGRGVEACRKRRLSRRAFPCCREGGIGCFLFLFSI